MGKGVATERLDRGDVLWSQLRGLLERAEGIEGDSRVNKQISLHRSREVLLAAASGHSGLVTLWRYDAWRDRSVRSREFLIARNIMRDFGPL